MLIPHHKWLFSRNVLEHVVRYGIFTGIFMKVMRIQTLVLSIGVDLLQTFIPLVEKKFPFLQMTMEFFFFLGMNTSRFTALNSLFLNNSKISFWRFEVVYTFIEENSSSAFDFKINQPPENGSCSIRPRNGNTSTLFRIDCTGWNDSNEIEDYSFYIGATPSEQLMLAFTQAETLLIQLPAGYGSESVMNLLVHIRDKRNCVREYLMESVTVVTDQAAIDGFINAVDNLGNGSTNNAMINVLGSGNQNRIGQIINLLSQEFNRRNEQDSQMAVQSKNILPHSQYTLRINF